MMIGRRRVKILVWSVAAILAIALVMFAGIYLFYVHPNDGRLVGPIESSRGPLSRRLDRVKSLLNDNLPHTIDMAGDAYGEAKLAGAAAVGANAIFSSHRFVSPYQVYLPVGEYPFRLEARDGLFIPSGHTLTVEPGLDGVVELALALFSPRAAVVRIRTDQDGASTSTLQHPGKSTSGEAPNFYERNIGRFLAVDRADKVERWNSAEVSLALTSTTRVLLTCDSVGPGCVVGDLGFYRVVQESKPNYLVILVDTLRGDGPFGGHAPTMQGLAAQSTVFTRALAPGNMTSPSTNAFLSCVRPSELGSLAFAYGVAKDRREEFYRHRRPSFPAHFARAGYDTAMIGNVSVISEAFGVGVDHGTAEQIAVETEAYDTPQLAREAIRWLERRGERPFMLYLHFNGPHAPYRAPLSDIRAVFPGFASLRSYPDMLLTLYQGEVHYTDRYIAPVLKALKTLGLDERTTVLLTADHGDQHEERPFVNNVAAPDFEGAYFDHGATLLNDEIRVPLIIREPGREPRVVDDLVTTLDVGPTLLEMAQVPGRESCSGRSLIPYMQGGSSTTQPSRVFGSEGFTGRAIVFDNRFKYVRTYEPTDKRVYSRRSWSGPKRLYAVPEQIFDLQADPGERRNLARQEAALLARSRDLYREFFAIKDSYELIIDNPDGQPVSAVFPTGEKVTLLSGAGDMEPLGSLVRFRGKESRRYVFRIDGSAGGEPQVGPIEVGGLTLPLRYTSMRLPIRVEPKALPIEASGEANLPDLANVAQAFVRRIEDDSQSDRRIVAGNPEFEKVLREWGYLNDR